jgi:hypothetical protein
MGRATAEIIRQTGKAKTGIWLARTVWRRRRRCAVARKDKAIAHSILGPQIAERGAPGTVTHWTGRGHGLSDRDQRQLGAAHLAGPWPAAASDPYVHAVQ